MRVHNKSSSNSSTSPGLSQVTPAKITMFKAAVAVLLVLGCVGISSTEAATTSSRSGEWI